MCSSLPVEVRPVPRDRLLFRYGSIELRGIVSPCALTWAAQARKSPVVNARIRRCTVEGSFCIEIVAAGRKEGAGAAEPLRHRTPAMH